MKSDRAIFSNGAAHVLDGMFQNQHPAWTSGVLFLVRLVAVSLAAAGPDQSKGLGVFVVEEVGVDRSVEARVVQLDREIIAALVGALRPGGPDLGLMWCTT